MEVTHVPLYTIGHGNRSGEDFIGLLQQYNIQYVVDVRSQPYSRHNPQFAKAALETLLAQHNFRYIFMGDLLGGRPADASCYVAGKIDYALLREKDFYRAGIARLRAAWEKQLRVALLCSEAKPQECHRGKLIGNTLQEEGISVLHIDEQGQLKGQEEVNLLLTGGQLSLFEDMSLVEQHGKLGYSRKKYKIIQDGSEGMEQDET